MTDRRKKRQKIISPFVQRERAQFFETYERPVDTGKGFLCLDASYKSSCNFSTRLCSGPRRFRRFPRIRCSDIFTTRMENTVHVEPGMRLFLNLLGPVSSLSNLLTLASLIYQIFHFPLGRFHSFKGITPPLKRVIVFINLCLDTPRTVQLLEKFPLLLYTRSAIFALSHVL